MHFITVVTLSPLQRLGCDYHILPHNSIINTNESAQCAVFLPHSLFLCTCQYLQAADPL